MNRDPDIKAPRPQLRRQASPQSFYVQAGSRPSRRSMDGMVPPPASEPKRPAPPPIPDPRHNKPIKPPRKKRNPLWVVLVSVLLVAALLVASFFGARAAYSYNLQPANPAATELAVVHIEPGLSSAKIAGLLAEDNLIRSAVAFRLHLRLNGISSRVQAGVYQLGPHQSVPEIAEIITSGDTVANTLTITSGQRLGQVIAKLQEVGYGRADINRALTRAYPYSILGDKPLHASLEGYLFPDTYHAQIGSDAAAMIDLILANMNEKATADMRQAWAAHGLDTFEALTLASIVQKEVAPAADQQRVAQVFLKRLALDMPLEADPTFEYAASLAGVKATPEIDSPYNTYKHKGLPPGPISNVGESAMLAVAEPADTDYLYFVSAPDGVTYFSQTKAEHDANIERYLR